MSSYTFGGKIDNIWRGNNCQQLTLVVTQGCNLRCTYCYMEGKNNEHRMDYETATQIIDYFIDNREVIFTEDYLLLEFIGGEPLLEIELIDRITDYFKISTFKKKSPWFGRYRISIATNGVLYDSPAVQRYIKKNEGMLSIGITIDGTKEKHDMHRIFPDGSGSYDIVSRNVKLWLEQYPGSQTKATFGSKDLPLLCESIIHLWSLGLKDVPANVVFEDIWEDGDADLYESQLKKLADYVLDNNLHDKVSVTLFSDSLGYREHPKALEQSACGVGRMFCVDNLGKIYSCVRFMQYSLSQKEALSYGDIYSGLDPDKVRNFAALSTKIQSSPECLMCDVGSECSHCAGYDYDSASSDTLYERAMDICKMHKAQARANHYYWSRLYNKNGIERQSDYKHDKQLLIMLADPCVEYCSFSSSRSSDEIRLISEETLLSGLSYARANFMQPVFVYPFSITKELTDLLSKQSVASKMDEFIITHMLPIEEYTIAKSILSSYAKCIWICSSGDGYFESGVTQIERNVILKINPDQIQNLADAINRAWDYFTRVNIRLGYDRGAVDLQLYQTQLEVLNTLYLERISKGQTREANILTDRLFLKQMDNCNAGEKNFTLAPDGQLYICPAFTTINKSVGSLAAGVQSTDIQFTRFDRAPLCTNCDAYQCVRCVYISKKKTRALNVPSSQQCRIALIERENSRQLLDTLHEAGYWLKVEGYPPAEYNDPIDLKKRIRVSGGV